MFSHLNPPQQQAVLTTKGKVLILAGAGSGKTSVLAYRIAHLINDLNTPPESILGLTFTNKAAQEMRERVGSLVSPRAAKKVVLSTFHSFCMQVLRKEIHRLGYTSNFTLYDEMEVRRLGTTLARYLLEHEGELPSLEQTFSKINYAKSRGQPLDPSNQTTPSWHDTFCNSLYERLKTCMRAYNAVDFDSLLLLTVQLFEEHPDLLSYYQEHYRFIMIDEYQDTNPVQYRLATLLATGHGNLCVVGDDDQSIYGWRGAEVQNILTFDAHTTIKLEQNYRSTPSILEAANAVIACNKERHTKSLWSNKERGDLLTLFHAPTELEEAQTVVQRMVKLHKERKVPWKEMAILYRSNALSRPFEMALMQTAWEKEGQWVRGIPFEVFGGTEFYERAEIKDLVAYLRVIANPLDQEALLRIINMPRRGISDQTLDLLTQHNRSQQTPLWTVLQQIASPLSCALKQELSARAITGIQAFVSLIEESSKRFASSPLHDATAWLVETIDYKQAIADEVKSDKMRAFKWDNIVHCLDSIAIYEEEKQAEGAAAEISLCDFLSSSTLDSSQLSSGKKRQTEDRVNLMTFHSAKGLEFTSCYLVGLEDHIIPHEKSLLDTGLEEERRLMYVAMTRAKRYLTMSMARKRKRMGKDISTQPSRFLFEIPKELIRICPWQTIDL